MSTKRQAFTLVELLVVITIIGMLMALLMPAVNAVRENGRKTTCMNNISQLGKAVLTYESSRKAFPGYDNKIGGAAALHGSWVVSILANIDRADVYNKWTGASGTPTITTVYLELLVCPSDPPDSPTGNPLAYVANCGRPDKASSTTTPPTGLAESALGNGIFFNLYDNSMYINMDYLTSSMADGASTTLLLSENISAGSWTAPDTQTTEMTTGFVWFDSDGGTNTNHKINSNKVTAPNPTTSYDYARPSSQHSGGVNAIFCDGHGRFLSDAMDYNVYIQLMTSSNAASDALPAVKGYTLNEADYNQ